MELRILTSISGERREIAKRFIEEYGATIGRSPTNPRMVGFPRLVSGVNQEVIQLFIDPGEDWEACHGDLPKPSEIIDFPSEFEGLRVQCTADDPDAPTALFAEASKTQLTE